MEKLEQWQRIKEIVGSALERQPAERSAFLDEACSQDTEVAAEVESLLAAYRDSDDLSENPWPVESTEQEAGPKTIGPYRLLNDWVSAGWARCGWRNKPNRYDAESR